MSKTLIKSGNVVVKSEDARVIDSNEMISERLRILTEILESQPQEPFFEEFTEGLDADQVEMLLADPDREDGEVGGAPAVDEEQLRQIVEDANNEAQTIIDNANEQAAAIIEEAKREAEGIRESARDDGHKEGYDIGYQEGLAANREYEASLNEKASMMDASYEEKIALLEPRFVDTLTDIYSHIFNIDLSDKIGLVKYLLKDAIRNIESKKNLFIHVSKDDFAEVDAARDELSEGLASAVTLEIIEDITLPKSSCYIEADSGIFDCSLGTELSLLKKELMLLSYQKEL